MKNSFTKIVIILSLCITIFVSICPPSFATPRRVEECGIESYVSRADPICGAITTRSAACGVEQYKEQQSKTCPGYLSAETLWFKKWNVLDSDCSSIPGTKGTYQFTGNRRQEECIDNCDGCNKPRCVKYAYAIECARTESIPKCRLPAFETRRTSSVVIHLTGIIHVLVKNLERFGKIVKFARQKQS